MTKLLRYRFTFLNDRRMRLTLTFTFQVGSDSEERARHRGCLAAKRSRECQVGTEPRPDRPSPGCLSTGARARKGPAGNALASEEGGRPSLAPGGRRPASTTAPARLLRLGRPQARSPLPDAAPQQRPNYRHAHHQRGGGASPSTRHRPPALLAWTYASQCRLLWYKLLVNSHPL